MKGTGRAGGGVFLRWLRRTAGAAATLLVLGIGLAVLDNNVSFARLSKAEFTANLDRALAGSTDWALKQYILTKSGTVATREGRELLSNAALAHMMVDCASISPDSRIKELSSGFVAAWKAEPSAWGTIVDAAIPATPLSAHDLETLEEYRRWMLYGAAPNAVSLSPKELEDMFSPDKYRTGEATHQLLALYLYRRSKGATPELDRLMSKIEERIAWEAALDFRVTDLYLQRIAFLLATGRTDLVQRRWAERALAAQQSDGGWLKSWHGWEPTPYRFSFDADLPTAHATAQGIWAVCMLKHRYPEWITRNYN